MDSIGEALCEIPVLFVRMIVAVLELTLALIQLLLDALGFSANVLASDPEPGESRLSGTRLLVALMPWLVIFTVGGGIFLYSHVQAKVTARRVADTRIVVRDTADALETPPPSEDGFAPVPAGYQMPEDAWGKPLQVEFRDGLANHILVVSSLGPDKAAGGFDDIVEQRKLPKGKIETTGNVVGALWNAFGPKGEDEDEDP